MLLTKFWEISGAKALLSCLKKKKTPQKTLEIANFTLSSVFLQKNEAICTEKHQQMYLQYSNVDFDLGLNKES